MYSNNPVSNPSRDCLIKTMKVIKSTKASKPILPISSKKRKVVGNSICV